MKELKLVNCSTLLMFILNFLNNLALRVCARACDRHTNAPTQDVHSILHYEQAMLICWTYRYRLDLCWITKKNQVRNFHPTSTHLPLLLPQYSTAKLLLYTFKLQSIHVMRLFYHIENFNWFVAKLCRTAKNHGRSALHAPYTMYLFVLLASFERK